MKPRTKPAEVRMDELMNAAQTLFLEKGIEATTINDIINKVGVAKGTFYHYFTSKNEIIDALKMRYMNFFMGEIESALQKGDANNSIEQISLWIHANILTYYETYLIHDVVFGGYHHHERSNPEKNLIVEQLITILEKGAKARVWSVGNVRTTALLIYSGVHGATDELISGQAKNTDTFIQEIIAAYLMMLNTKE